MYTRFVLFPAIFVSAWRKGVWIISNPLILSCEPNLSYENRKRLETFRILITLRECSFVALIHQYTTKTYIDLINQYLHRLSIFSINCTENSDCVMTAWNQSLCKSAQRHLYRSAKRVWSCRYQRLERLSLCPFQT